MRNTRVESFNTRYLLSNYVVVLCGRKVVAAGGIPRLVSLFANPGAEGGAKSARANAGICLAKLAREPRHKEVGLAPLQ